MKIGLTQTIPHRKSVLYRGAVVEAEITEAGYVRVVGMGVGCGTVLRPDQWQLVLEDAEIERFVEASSS